MRESENEVERDSEREREKARLIERERERGKQTDRQKNGYFCLKHRRFCLI